MTKSQEFLENIAEGMWGLGPGKVVYFTKQMAQDLYDVDPSTITYEDTGDGNFAVKAPLTQAQWDAILAKLENEVYTTTLTGDIMKFDYNIKPMG